MINAHDACDECRPAGRVKWAVTAAAELAPVGPSEAGADLSPFLSACETTRDGGLAESAAVTTGRKSARDLGTRSFGTVPHLARAGELLLPQRCPRWVFRAQTPRHVAI